MKEIVVSKRANDYHACLKGHPEIWACGNSPRMAIGDLILSHGATFGVEVIEN